MATPNNVYRDELHAMLQHFSKPELIDLIGELQGRIRLRFVARRAGGHLDEEPQPIEQLMADVLNHRCCLADPEDENPQYDRRTKRLLHILGDPYD